MEHTFKGFQFIGPLLGGGKQTDLTRNAVRALIPTLGALAVSLGLCQRAQATIRVSH